MEPHAEEIRDWVQSGGSYLGFCLGAYLAARGRGFDIATRAVSRYIETSRATVNGIEDAIVEVNWMGQRRHMFFQDGPQFGIKSRPGDAVLARYENRTIAAVVTEFRSGRVGLVGPHPEADQTWYGATELTNPDGIRFDLGFHLISNLVNG